MLLAGCKDEKLLLWSYTRKFGSSVLWFTEYCVFKPLARLAILHMAWYVRKTNRVNKWKSQIWLTYASRWNLPVFQNSFMLGDIALPLLGLSIMLSFCFINIIAIINQSNTKSGNKSLSSFYVQRAIPGKQVGQTRRDVRKRALHCSSSQFFSSE